MRQVVNAICLQKSIELNTLGEMKQQGVKPTSSNLVATPAAATLAGVFCARFFSYATHS